MIGHWQIMTRLQRGALALILLMACAGASLAQEAVTRPTPRPQNLALPDPATAQAAALAATAAAPGRAARAPTPLIPPAPNMPDAAALAAPSGVTLGPETNLPLPRYVSLKSREGNVRRGPSLAHRIDWVFTREDMPLMVTGEFGHWRRVVDREGLGGWVHYALISGTRTVIVDNDMQPLYRRPNADSTQNALLEAGVIARLEACQIDWCRVAVSGYSGWLPKSAIWGVGPDEILD